MKYLKMLGLAAIAALALTAFGAGAASASTILCTVNQSPCGSVYGAGTTITGGLKAGTSATLTNSFGNVVCTNSSISGKTTAMTNGTGEITSATWAGCTREGGECTVEALNLPWHAEVTTETAKSNGNGKMLVKSSGKGAPEAKVICGSWINCTFGTNLATLNITGGSPAAVKANAIVMDRISGFLCPKEAKWDAEYILTAPHALYVI